MNQLNVIKNPILSEKAYAQMEKGVYIFLVDARSKKDDVAKAVEKQFSVEVTKVNLLAQSEKQKRVGRTRKYTTVGGGKKAFVWLKQGQKIEAFATKTDATTKKSKKDKKENK